MIIKWTEVEIAKEGEREREGGGGDLKLLIQMATTSFDVHKHYCWKPFRNVSNLSTMTKFVIIMSAKSFNQKKISQTWIIHIWWAKMWQANETKNLASGVQLMVVDFIVYATFFSFKFTPFAHLRSVNN